MSGLYHFLVVETFKPAVVGTFIKIRLNLRNFRAFWVSMARAAWRRGGSLSEAVSAENSYTES
jgi:hypothetical protein